MIEEKTLKTLEYDKILRLVAKYTVSTLASEKILNAKPYCEREKVNRLLDETEAAHRLMDMDFDPYFSVENITQSCEKAYKGMVLSIAEILNVSKVLRLSRTIKNNYLKVSYQPEILNEYFYNVLFDADLEKYIESIVINENEIADHASENLRRIRNAIRKINQKIKEDIAAIIGSSQYKTALQDSLYTIRGDRYVLPVKAEYKSQIPGLVHDQSASGATLFIEPFSVLQSNNELKQLLAEERNEIEKILLSISQKIGEIKDMLLRNVFLLTELDVIFARAKYARETNSVKPEIISGGKLSIDSGRHPLINAKYVVPVSVRIDEYRMLIITGPNTGGKTVTLKLAGLFILLAQSGFYLPCEQATLSVFESVYCDIGDEQSIEQSLSTFSSHMKNLVHITKNANKNSFVLLDELGAGTDPSEGSALAVAIAEMLIAQGARGMISTHYNELKQFALENPFAQNASMDFDPDTFEPTYKILIGIAGASNALQIAKRLGLSGDIITRAKTKLSRDKIQYEKAMLELDLAKKEVEKQAEKIKWTAVEKEKELFTIQKEKEKLLEDKKALEIKLRKSARDLLSDYIEEAENIIDQMKENLKKNDESALFEIRKLNKKLNSLEEKNIDQEALTYTKKENTVLKVGERVLIESTQKIGVIKKLNAKKCDVDIGGIIVTVSLSEVVAVEENGHAIEKKNISLTIPKSFAKQSLYEINVIGKTKDEAEHVLLQFIDDAILGGRNQIKIIHGVGSGILKKFVHRFLSQHKNIEHFRSGEFGEGGEGVTIADLK